MQLDRLHINRDPTPVQKRSTLNRTYVFLELDMNALQVCRHKDPRWGGRRPDPVPSHVSRYSREDSSIVSDSSSELESTRSSEDLEASFDERLWELGSFDDDSISTSEVYADDNMLSGLGLTFGKLVRTVGKAELHGVKWLCIRYRRTIINHRLKRVGHFKRGAERSLDDLIEFSNWCVQILACAYAAIQQIN